MAAAAWGQRERCSEGRGPWRCATRREARGVLTFGGRAWGGWLTADAVGVRGGGEDGGGWADKRGTGARARCAGDG